MTLDITTVILAGGQGSRFWPISRMSKPKQFLSISESGESLIQATARRILPISSKEKVLVVTNVLHRTLIEEHVPYAAILCEPFARNTAAAIGLAAIKVARRNPKEVMIVLPADHAVKDEEVLRKVLLQAATLASEKEMLVTIGIPPTSAHTGYGYIRTGEKLGGANFKVQRFFEKPNAERAKKYLESGEYFWNSGMFVWRADVILKAIEEEMPDLYAALKVIEASLNTEREQKVVAQVFEKLESISIDFGVMEHAQNCAVVVAESFGWNDVGSWDAWSEHFEKDAQGNLVHGNALLIDSENCVINGNGRLVAVLGAKDLVVIVAGDATLVCPREKVQDVRKIVDELKRSGRNDLI